jgi:alkanesulfonate monooxygenase SsuD/methylene tetrahydromethanopterin reductase-like flavin-dependent oxidoreductase (luciferase family)
MCPVGYSEYAVNAIRKAEYEAGRGKSGDIVQYVSCLCRRDSNEARRAIRVAIAANLTNYWTVPSARQAMFGQQDISESEFGKAIERLAAGESSQDVIDDRFVDAFSVAGDVDGCIDLIAAYERAGVDEVVLTFLGSQPAEDIAYFGAALKGV